MAINKIKILNIYVYLQILQKKAKYKKTDHTFTCNLFCIKNND